VGHRHRLPAAGTLDLLAGQLVFDLEVLAAMTAAKWDHDNIVSGKATKAIDFSERFRDSE
jgi:hypothetical protein